MSKPGDSDPELDRMSEQPTLRRDLGAAQELGPAMAATQVAEAPSLPDGYHVGQARVGQAQRAKASAVADSGDSARDVSLAGPSVIGQASSQRYSTTRTLGAGGMGEVKLCRDALIGRDVAVKVMHSSFTADSDAHARFLREARVQGQLEHPSVVPVYDLGSNAQGEPFFTMKRVKGLTLEEIIVGIREGDASILHAYSRRQLLTAISRVCLAVAFAHSRGVVHRDLKPANVMLGDYGEVNVLDWGVAKIRGAADIAASDPEQAEADFAPPSRAAGSTRAGTILGTPGFMAPEQARGDIDAIDGRADVYALGCVLFELLALEPLHQGRTTQALLVSTITGHQERPSERAPHLNIPPELDEMVLRATQLEPSARFDTARAMNDAIERFLDGEQDIERRREQAQRHTLNAQLALAGVAQGGPESDTARARGMRELSTALALDPSHEGAMHTLMKVLLDPDITLPKEAEEELLEVNRQDRVKAANATSVAYAAWLLPFPLLILMGVRSWGVMVLMGTFLFLQIALSLWMGLTGNVLPRFVRWTIPATFITVCSLSALFGPLVLVPGAAAVNGAVMMVSLRANRVTQRGIMLAAISAITLPWVLQLTGVLPPAYAFEGGVWQVLPQVVNFPAEWTMWLLYVASLLTVISGNVLVGRAVNSLTAAERRIFAQAWRLRQLLPRDEHPARAGAAAQLAQ